eukprot:CAMPEP_0170538654 /NCGR_PEP_ID=MMETSP0209-20121228/103450_1 /TAXON_ID=665100 ORGANISM="Litonotus pictus, Strain P1" /NCGR_SAMPLE_ID=MMETSP0209 /ASSEMBLY_ACC=CAM_ASM_000301 /LENGTH=427 /DNA_ID=CAMNT_0010840405 /DNA_START=331 /DNA_END=1611 /DNA_ORIENTATION=-
MAAKKVGMGCYQSVKRIIGVFKGEYQLPAQMNSIRLNDQQKKKKIKEFAEYFEDLEDEDERKDFTCKELKEQSKEAEEDEKDIETLIPRMRRSAEELIIGVAEGELTEKIIIEKICPNRSKNMHLRALCFQAKWFTTNKEEEETASPQNNLIVDRSDIVEKPGESSSSEGKKLDTKEAEQLISSQIPFKFSGKNNFKDKIQDVRTSILIEKIVTSFAEEKCRNIIKFNIPKTEQEKEKANEQSQDLFHRIINTFKALFYDTKIMVDLCNKCVIPIMTFMFQGRKAFLTQVKLQAQIDLEKKQKQMKEKLIQLWEDIENKLEKGKEFDVTTQNGVDKIKRELLEIGFHENEVYLNIQMLSYSLEIDWILSKAKNLKDDIVGEFKRRVKEVPPELGKHDENEEKEGNSNEEVEENEEDEDNLKEDSEEE